MHVANCHRWIKGESRQQYTHSGKPCCYGYVLLSYLTQTWLNNPGCLTWKGDLMVAGDVNGVLIFCDTKAQAAR